jgi:hypothetical protein
MTKITQLYEQLELFTEGDPPRHSLFVMGRLLGSPDQLLLIDPPPDVADRFSLAENTAALFTGPEMPKVGLPQMQTLAGGVAHISVGQHLLDIHSRQGGNIVYFPTLGILCGGTFGSDLLLPQMASGSDGGEEIEALRLLAQLVKARRPKLYIPQAGSLGQDIVDVMTRLANDVGYLHNLRRVIPAAVQRGDSLSQVQELGATLLPENRRSYDCQIIHQRNIEILYGRGSVIRNE